ALMGSDEEKALEILNKNQEVHTKLIGQFNGTLIKEMGDGMLISFHLASDAVRCAIEIQSACNKQDIPLKIGIHEGEMVFVEADVFGDAVNIASRLQEGSKEGDIHISSSVHKNVKNKAGINTSFVEEKSFKNVDEPVKVYKVILEKGKLPKAQLTRLKHPPKLAGSKVKIVVAAIITMLLLVYVGYQYILNEPQTYPPTTAEAEINKSIAVLPFVNMSNDPEQQYFSDGIMEAILNDLSKIRELKVISRTSVMQYRNTEKTIPQIAEELGVTYLLEGGVQSSGGKVRINAQLINATQDAHVWSDNYDRELINIFELQSDIAQKIASELNTVLSPSEIDEIQMRSTSNPEAYNLYMMGRYFWYKRTGDALRKSIDYFEQSLAIDPEYALAYSGLADGFLMRVPYDNLPKAIGYDKAKEYALRALEINPNLAQAYATLGTVAKREWQWNEAEAKLKRSIELDPNYIMARHWYAEYLFVFGPSDKLLEQINTGLRLDPFSFLMQSQLAWYYYNEGELDMALKELKTLLELDPFDVRYSHAYMFKIYLKQGKEEEAFNSLKQHWAKHNYMEGRVHLAEDIYKRQGMKSLFSWLVEFNVKIPNMWAPWIAECYIVLGEKQLALDWLEKSYERRDDFSEIIKSADYEILRSEPRYIELLKKMGLNDWFLGG
ncbi:MAG: hypothetical protein OER83_06710, partial [Flavobacteriaceae bacterium]|nr:hypothetical protein [Flavobacteriaceae bacterium]